jgi:hypothetical protein
MTRAQLVDVCGLRADLGVLLAGLLCLDARLRAPLLGIRQARLAVSDARLRVCNVGRGRVVALQRGLHAAEPCLLVLGSVVGLLRQQQQVVEPQQLGQQALDLAGGVVGQLLAALGAEHRREEHLGRAEHVIHAAVVGLRLAVAGGVVRQPQRQPAVRCLDVQVSLGLFGLDRSLDQDLAAVALAAVLPNEFLAGVAVGLFVVAEAARAVATGAEWHEAVGVQGIQNRGLAAPVRTYQRDQADLVRDVDRDLVATKAVTNTDEVLQGQLQGPHWFSAWYVIVTSLGEE